MELESIELRDYDSNSHLVDVNSVLNYIEGGDGGGEGPTPPSGPEYTHIGNSNGGSSGIDSSTTNYDPSTGVVEFNVSGSGVLTVDSDTLYVDNGNSSEGSSDQTMGVYLDMGLGFSSALIPSSNTVTSPEASIIVDSTQTTVNTLDGTVGDVNAMMPWMIELTDYDDVFIGRDAVYDSATNSYDPGNEVIIATYGYDMIDGGGGLRSRLLPFTSMDQAMELTST